VLLGLWGVLLSFVVRGRCLLFVVVGFCLLGVVCLLRVFFCLFCAAGGVCVFFVLRRVCVCSKRGARTARTHHNTTNKHKNLHTKKKNHKKPKKTNSSTTINKTKQNKTKQNKTKQNKNKDKKRIPVGGDDEHGRELVLERAVEEREALDVQHVHLFVWRG
jgi:hypothetical protein